LFFYTYIYKKESGGVGFYALKCRKGLLLIINPGNDAQNFPYRIKTVDVKNQYNERREGMRKAILVIMAILLLAASTWAEDKGAGSGQEVTVTGHLTCAHCRLAAGPAHKCSPECCMGCIKGGDSALLQDGKNIYLLLNKEKGKTLMTPERIAFAGGSVKVKGIMVKTEGMQAIYVETMDKSM
jgi:hypothetical protein